jgi:antitoxin HicB
MKTKNIGSSFDSWLRKEGIYEEVSANAIKRVVARQVEAAMQEKGLSKSEMARRMHTSRAALDRLLDPENAAVTLSTLQKAAAVASRSIFTVVLFPAPFGSPEFRRERIARKPRLPPSHPHIFWPNGILPACGL